MDIYKKASKTRLRVQTSVGPLSVEQLWDLTLEQLNAVAVHLDAAYKESNKKSFLETKTEKDKTTKLMFDIVLDILNTKVANRDKAAKAAETKTHNQKILNLIANKQDEELAGKSVAELEKMLK